MQNLHFAATPQFERASAPSSYAPRTDQPELGKRKGPPANEKNPDGKFRIPDCARSYPAVFDQIRMVRIDFFKGKEEAALQILRTNIKGARGHVPKQPPLN